MFIKIIKTELLKGVFRTSTRLPMYLFKHHLKYNFVNETLQVNIFLAEYHILNTLPNFDSNIINYNTRKNIPKFAF